MPLNTNHPTPPKGASCSKVGIPEGVPRAHGLWWAYYLWLVDRISKVSRRELLAGGGLKRTQENSIQA